MKLFSFIYLGLLCCSFSMPAQAAGESIIAQRDAGSWLHRQGRYADAIEVWQQALDALHSAQPHSTQSVVLHIEIHRRLAAAAHALGLNERAERSLRAALSLVGPGAEDTPALAIQASLALSQLGDLALGEGRWQEAGQHLGESVKQARALEHPPSLAHVLNNLGNALSQAGDDARALAVYRESLQWADAGDQTLLRNRLLLNLTRLHVRLLQLEPDDHGQAAYERFLQAAASLLQQPDPALAQAGDLIALALLGQQLQQWPGLARAEAKPITSMAQQVDRAGDRTAAAQLPPAPRSAADQITVLHRALLERALHIARQFQDPHHQAYALGYLAQLDEQAQNYRQAFRRTEQALHFADQARDPANRYLWQWQLGRLHRAQGQIADAIAAYRRAVETLNPIRASLMGNARSASSVFRERIQPVYFELADLLLTQAAVEQAAGRAGAQTREAARLADTAYQAELTLLREARDTVEFLKTAELQDYFQDECTVALQAKQTQLDAVDPRSAVIYPIILPQRLVLLLSIQDRLQQIVVPVTAAELEQTAQRFRRHLQIRASQAYLREARQLYDWLIRPLRPALNETAIETLVFVPDGVLRTIPFATLQDGRQFLIERYAVAMTPSLSLTDPRPFWREDTLSQADTAVLIAGLSEGVQGFSPLPSVSRELATVQSLVGGEILQDRDYSKSNLSGALTATEYSVLHLATHGVFGGSDEHSFLLTYDDKLNMRQLGELVKAGIFREQPLELLTLSACQTALGNERAALGLAGIAVQSGARSATASLWFVDDAATASLMSEFYRQLAEHKLPKARALRNAQISLLKQARYRHPIYWGPYLMIGNWL